MTNYQITENEIFILSYYRACELAGALLFGTLALHTSIDDVRIPLTRHCAEEVHHAWLWTETIEQLGYTPRKITSTYQSEYGREFGLPRNMLEIFCLTQIFEARTVAHFERHLAIEHLHPLIRKTLHQMIEDEAGHLDWIKGKLDQYVTENGSEKVTETMTKLQQIDTLIYGRITQHERYRRYFGEVDPGELSYVK